MPVTKGTKSDDAEKSHQTQGTESDSPVGKISEQKETQEIKKGLQQVDTNVPIGETRSPSAEKGDSKAGDDAIVAEGSEMLKEDPSTTRSEVGIPSTDPSSEQQQSEGISETQHQSPSGDGIPSPDKTSSLSTETLSGEELETHGSQGSDHQCRSCNSRYTKREGKSDSCSDQCPKCELATTSPFIPQIPQPVGNPVKNQRDDIPLQPMGQHDEEPESPVVAVGVGGPGMPPEDNPSPEKNPTPGDNSSPEDRQLEAGQGATTTTTTTTTTPPTAANANSQWPISLKILMSIIGVVAVVAGFMWLFVLYPHLFPGRRPSTTLTEAHPNTPFRDIAHLAFEEE